MISLSELALNLENKLNDSLAGLQFEIFADTGKFKRAVRKGNTVTEIINGELRAVSSDVTKLAEGLQVITQNCKLNLIVKLEDEEESYTEKFIDIDQDTGEITEKEGAVIQGNIDKIKMVREALNMVFQNSTVENEKIDEENSYTVTAVYNLVDSGQRNQVQMLGNSYTFTVYIYYFFIQNGINTQDYTFKLDGLLFPMQTMSIDRIPTMDGFVPLNTKNGAIKNLSSISSFSISLVVPATTSQSESIFDWVFDGGLNVAHILTIKDKNYLVSFGQTTLSGETVKNIGQTITFVECPDEYDLIEIPNTLYLYKSNETRSHIELLLPEDCILYNFNTKRFYQGAYSVYAGETIYLATQDTEIAYLTKM